eukprot:Nk52_evm26s210 gene=Nk52_evmTU26s210
MKSKIKTGVGDPFWFKHSSSFSIRLVMIVAHVFTFLLVSPQFILNVHAADLNLIALIPWTGWSVGDTISGGVPLAVEYINNNATLLPGYTVKWNWKDSKCNAATAIAEATTMNTAHDADVIIGPACSTACEPTGLLAEFWDVPIISYACGLNTLSNKKLYPTFARTVGPLTKYGEAFSAFINSQGWRKVAIVTSSNSLYSSAAQAILTELAKVNVTVQAFQVFNSLQDPTSALEEVKKTNIRVICYLSAGTDMRRSVLAAKDIGIIGPEYVWLTSGEVFRDSTFTSDADSRTQEALEAIKGFIGFSSYVNETGTEFQNFLGQARTAMTTYFNAPVPADKEIFSRVAVVYDSVLLWAEAATRVIAKGGNPRSGKEVVAEYPNVKFSGISGTIALDSNFDINRDYQVFNRVPSSARATTVKTVGYYRSETNTFEAESGVAIEWPSGSTQTPLDGSCPADCTNHGSCNSGTGVCSCYDGYNGTECSTVQPADALVGTTRALAPCASTLLYKVATSGDLTVTISSSTDFETARSHIGVIFTKTYADISTPSAINFTESNFFTGSTLSRSFSIGGGSDVLYIAIKANSSLCPSSFAFNVDSASDDVSFVIVVLFVLVITFYMRRKQQDNSMHWLVNGDELVFSTEQELDSISVFSTQETQGGALGGVFSQVGKQKSGGNRDVVLFKNETVHCKHENRIKNLKFSKPALKTVNAIYYTTHYNLVKFIGMSQTPDGIVILTEHCSKGSAEDILLSDMNLDWTFQFSFILDACRGLKFLHKSNVKFHGTLKPSQVLVDSRWITKIGDSGFVRIFDLADDSSENVFSQFYTAPELLHMNRKEITDEQFQMADSYSFGMFTIEAASRKKAFDDHKLTPEDLIMSNFTPKIDENIPSMLRELINDCINTNPKSRPGMSKIYKSLALVNPSKDLNLTENIIRMLETYSRKLEENLVSHTIESQNAQHFTEILLKQLVLPSQVAKINDGFNIDPEMHSQVGVAVIELVGLEGLFKEGKEGQFLCLTSELMWNLESLMESYQVVRLSCFSNTFAIACGLEKEHTNLDHLLRLGFAFQEALSNLLERKPECSGVGIQMGINLGPCLSAVVGSASPRLFLMGNTVNDAFSIFNSSSKGKILIAKQYADLPCVKNMAHFKLEPGPDVTSPSGNKLSTMWVSKNGTMPDPSANMSVSKLSNDENEQKDVGISTEVEGLAAELGIEESEQELGK